MSFEAAWIRAFALTLIVELLVAVPLLGSQRPLLRRIFAVAFGQLSTHPLVWFVFSALPLQRGWYLVVAEGWAVVIETFLYLLVFSGLSRRSALAAAALANAASVTAGLILRAFVPGF